MSEPLHASPDPTWHRYSTGAEPVDSDPKAVFYGSAVPDEDTVRLLGSVDGKRILDLGCGTGANAVLLARQGAKVFAIDRSTANIGLARQRADTAEVRVEVHQGNLADLAFLRSDTVDGAISVMALAEITDLPRVFRQVHRVLKPEAPFVLSVPHPAFTMFDPAAGEPLRVRHPYERRTPGQWTLDGEEILDQPRTVSQMFTTLRRASFEVDQLLEPIADRAGRSEGLEHIVPPTLVIRARKLGN